MKQVEDPIQFPCDAQSNPFFCALASALLPAFEITEETPYYCVEKSSLCVRCGDCGDKTNMQKHHLALYHDYQTVTGVSFGWAWPEDDRAEYRTIGDRGARWRWPDEFIDYIMGFAGLSWRRFTRGTDKGRVYREISRSIDEGLPVLLKLGTGWDWHVVTGYDDRALYGLDSHKHYDSSVHPQIKPDSYTDDGLFVLSRWFEPFEDLIIMNGRSKPTVALPEVLAHIIHTLEHPAHAKLEADLAERIDQVTADTAEDNHNMVERRGEFSD